MCWESLATLALSDSAEAGCWVLQAQSSSWEVVGDCLKEEVEAEPSWEVVVEEPYPTMVVVVVVVVPSLGVVREEPCQTMVVEEVAVCPEELSCWAEDSGREANLVVVMEEPSSEEAVEVVASLVAAAEPKNSTAALGKEAKSLEVKEAENLAASHRVSSRIRTHGIQFRFLLRRHGHWPNYTRFRRRQHIDSVASGMVDWPRRVLPGGGTLFFRRSRLSFPHHGIYR